VKGIVAGKDMSCTYMQRKETRKNNSTGLFPLGIFAIPHQVVAKEKIASEENMWEIGQS